MFFFFSSTLISVHVFLASFFRLKQTKKKVCELNSNKSFFFSIANCLLIVAVIVDKTYLTVMRETGDNKEIQLSNRWTLKTNRNSVERILLSKPYFIEEAPSVLRQREPTSSIPTTVTVSIEYASNVVTKTLSIDLNSMKICNADNDDNEAAVSLQKKRANVPCEMVVNGARVVSPPYLSKPITLDWTHDCAANQTTMRLSGFAIGWLGVGFVANGKLNPAFKMAGGDYYLFANDGTKASSLNGRGVSNEYPRRNDVKQKAFCFILVCIDFAVVVVD